MTSLLHPDIVEFIAIGVEPLSKRDGRAARPTAATSCKSIAQRS